MKMLYPDSFKIKVEAKIFKLENDGNQDVRSGGNVMKRFYFVVEAATK
jgi:hypothetical protein